MDRCWRWRQWDWGIRGFISVWPATTQEPKCASSDSKCKVWIFDFDGPLKNTISHWAFFWFISWMSPKDDVHVPPTAHVFSSVKQWEYFLFPLSAPPVIKGPSETSEVSVVFGFSTQLLCDVEGSPTPSITWFKDNQPIVSSPRLTYTRGGQSLRVASVQGDSTGLYTCRATNPAGTAVKHYSLSVLGKMHSKSFKTTFFKC